MQLEEAAFHFRIISFSNRKGDFFVNKSRQFSDEF
jgi:hypothetical protein